MHVDARLITRGGQKSFLESNIVRIATMISGLFESCREMEASQHQQQEGGRLLSSRSENSEEDEGDQDVEGVACNNEKALLVIHGTSNGPLL